MIKNIKNNLDPLNKAFMPKYLYRDLVKLPKIAKLLLMASLILSTIVFITTKDFSTISYIGLFANYFMVINLILLDVGKMSNYFWAMLSVILWFYIALENNAIGDQYTQIFALSMQFVGPYLWIKDMDSDDNVKPKQLSLKLMALSIVAIGIIYGIVLSLALSKSGAQPYLTSALLPLNMISMILMVTKYKEQWIGWIALNLINVVIWVSFVSSGTDGAVIMLTLQMFMLINSLYGFYDWNKRFKNNESEVTNYE